MINIRTLRIYPTEVKSFGGNCVSGCENLILAGKCYDPGYYYAYLTFPPFTINENEVLNSAALKLYCKNAWGSPQNLRLCVNDGADCRLVNGIGTYEWDVTGFVGEAGEAGGPILFSLYAGELIHGCKMREFEAAAPDQCPVLEVVLDEVWPHPPHGPVNYENIYDSHSTVDYSAWIECLSLLDYYYFIKNMGTEAVTVAIEVSPDCVLIAADLGPITVEAGETIYLPPLRRSGYVRIAYQNQSGGGTNPILVWFQGIH